MKDFTVDHKGDAFISQRKAAELLGVNPSTFMNYISREHSNTNTSKGLSDLTLQSASTYYAYESKASTKKARHFLKLLLQAGAKAFIYDQVGFKLSATKPMCQLTTLQLCDLIRSTELDRLAELEKYENLNAEFLNVMEEKGFYQFITVSKLLAKTGLGRTTLMAILREKGILLNSNLPAQTQVDNGRFVVKRYYLEEVEKHCTTTLVTEKGFIFLAELLHDWVKPLDVPAPKRVLKLTNGCDNIQDWFDKGWTKKSLVKKGYAKWKKS